MDAIQRTGNVSDSRRTAILLTALFVLTFSDALSAAISTTGNVTPDPSTTTAESTLIVGNVADGGLFVDGGSHVSSSGTYMAYNAGVSATATINGDASTWSPYSLYVGRAGLGVLSIANGGSVNAMSVRIGLQAGSRGTVTVDGAASMLSSGDLFVGSSTSNLNLLTIANGGNVDLSGAFSVSGVGVNGNTVVFNGGTLTTRDLFAAPHHFLGTGTINTHGLLTDSSLIFDQNNGLQKQIVLSNGTTQNITVNLNVDGSGTIGAGYYGQGAIEIAGGVTVASSRGYIGYNGGSNGTVQVSGATWNASEYLVVGNSGIGNMTIEQGGKVNSPGILETYYQPSQGSVIGANDGAVGEVSVVGNGSVWDCGNTWIHVAGNTHSTQPRDISGTLRILDGGKVLSKGGQVGVGVGVHASVVVSGNGSSWLNSSFLHINESNTLEILDGGTVSSVDVDVNRGKVTIDGNGSSWTTTGTMDVGNTGLGEIIISNGGDLSTAAVINYVGNSSAGKVTVTGPGSTWAASGSIAIANSSASSSLLISDGGTVSSSSGSIRSKGTAAITGVGSSWINTGTFSISGSLTILEGGSLLSRSSGISGTATISGDDSAWMLSDDFSLGNGATSGTLYIETGALVRVANNTTIRDSSKINLNGGTFTSSAILFQGFSGQFNWTGGTLHVGTFNGNLTNSAGTLAPGQPIGKTTVSASYTQQANATLQIEIGGLTATTQYDNVAVSGNTTLGGTLELSLVNGFVPNAANTFTILTSTGTLSGTFANVANAERLLTTDGLGTFLVNYGASSPFNTKQVVLSAFNITGDFNTDGKVDAADYTYWRRNTGATVPRFTSADADGNGLIDQADYTIWRSHFGLAAAAGSGAGAFTDAASVPEPAAQLLLLLCTLTVANCRRIR